MLTGTRTSSPCQNRSSEIVSRWLAPARAKAGRAAERLVADGRRLSPEQAVDLVLAGEMTTPHRAGPWQPLTRREAEVAALAARGLTNRDIAAQLFLSVLLSRCTSITSSPNWASTPGPSWPPGPWR